MLIASIAAPDADAFVRAARRASPHSDLLELRLDRLAPAARERLDDLMRRAPGPVLATCRRSGDGGGFSGAEEERRSLLRRAMGCGASWVDLEWGSGVECLAADPGRARVVLSHHDGGRSVRDPEALYRRMAAVPGVSMVKLVGSARGLGDNLRVRRLLAAGDRPVPLIAFCTGGAGIPSRILALSWGSAATFGSAAGEAVAPGQLPVEEMDRLYRVREITDETRLVGVTGFPLAHSLSPRVHNAAYRHLGLDFVYLPLESRRIEPVLRLSRELALRGLSVTLPHKRAMLRHVDAAEPLAREVGAVNTVLWDRDQGVGFNTDVSGGMAPLRRRVRLRGTEVAVLGGGGAARALIHGLAADGASVTVFSRSPARARKLAREAGVRLRPLADLEDHPYQVLINATPVGMEPAVEDLPLPVEWIRGELVYDIIYHPRETRLLREARARGLETLEGLEMFLAQAAEQFRLFTSRDVPLEVLRRSALEVLDRRRSEPDPPGEEHGG